jgi:hypothetical protein
MNETAALDGPAIVERLLQRVEDEAGLGGAGDPPADDPAGEGVDDEGDVDEALPRRDIGEILSANSGRRRESGEARYACLGPRQAVQPVHDPRYVHRGGSTDLLERGFGQSDVAASAHSEGAHAL